MFARIMGIVSPSIFLSSSIVWGAFNGEPYCCCSRVRAGRFGGVYVVSCVA